MVVTGGAGFIGSHLVEALVRAGAQVTVLDDLSSGDRANLDAVKGRIRFVKGDCADAAALDRLLPGAQAVWHLAANPEVRTGETDPASHYRANVAATFAVLEGLRRHAVPAFVLASTSTVYGEATVRPTPEDYGPLLPVSVYGACKLACEALASAYAGTFGADALIFRFANVVGGRSRHGVAWDLVRKLRRDPDVLEILGDGTQTKSYVSVEDTVAGMLHGYRHAPRGAQAYNIGSRDAIPVTEVAALVAKAMGVRPRHRFLGGPGGAGWKGDVKTMQLATRRLETLDWKPRHTSAQAMARAVQGLVKATQAQPRSSRSPRSSGRRPGR